MMQQSNPQNQSLEKTDEQKKNDPTDMMNNNSMGGMNPNMMPGRKIHIFC